MGGWFKLAACNSMPVFTTIVSVVSPALQMALAIIMVGRKLHRRFPFFFIYTIFSIAVIGPRLAVRNNPVQLFAVYWTTEIVFDLFALLAVHDALKLELKAIAEEYPLFRFVPVTMLAIITAVALWRAAYYAPGHIMLAYLSAGAYAFMFGVRVVEVSALLLAVELERRRLMTLPRHERSVLEGFGLAAAVGLLAYVPRSLFGQRFEEWFLYLPPGAYIVATVIWLTAFWRHVPQRESLDLERVERMIQFLRQRKRAAGKMRRSLAVGFLRLFL